MADWPDGRPYYIFSKLSVCREDQKQVKALAVHACTYVSPKFWALPNT